MPYKRENNQVLPVLNPHSKWKKPSDTVDTVKEPEDTGEQKPKQDESGQEQPQGKGESKDEPEHLQNESNQAQGQDYGEPGTLQNAPAQPEQKVQNTPSPENKATNSGAMIKEVALDKTPAEPSLEQAKREEAKPQIQTKVLKEAAQTRESSVLSTESKESKKEADVSVQCITDSKPEQTQEVAQKETKARVQPSADLKPVQIQKVAQESVVVNKKEAGAKNPDNEGIQKEDKEALISSHTAVQETKERNQINDSGRKFIIPPLENAVIPMAPQQATEQNNNPKLKDNSQASPTLLMNKDEAEGINANYRIEDIGKKMDDLYKSAPPTGPPLNTSGKLKAIPRTSPQGSGDSAAGEPVELKGLIVSYNQSGITATEETALPDTGAHSTLRNHSPPL